MSSRRSFLRTVAAAPGISLFARSGENVLLGCQTNAWPINPADLSTFFAVLDKIRAYGFQGFETSFANLQSQFASPGETRRKIEATHLQFFGIHIFLAQYDPETHVAPAALYERVARGGAGLGAERLILSGAPVSTGSELDRGALAKKVEALNRAGGYARNVGLRLVAYHNHAPEFANGAAEMTALIDGTDPANVGFLLDAGHAFEANADVTAYFRRHHERIIGLHLRDYKDGEQVPLGQGGFPLMKLAAAIEQLQWKGWILCEEERLHGKPGDEAMRPARAALFHAFRGE
jgi:inosose dehydratase